MATRKMGGWRGLCNPHAEMSPFGVRHQISRFIHDNGRDFSRWVLARSESLIIVNGGNFAPPEMEERRDDFNPTATQRFNHRRLPATAPAQARDRRSRHGAARQLVHHGRLPAESLGRSTVTAETERRRWRSRLNRSSADSIGSSLTLRYRGGPTARPMVCFRPGAIAIAKPSLPLRRSVGIFIHR